MNLSLITPRRAAAVVIAVMLALGSFAPAQAARVQEASVKSAIKVGAKCTKLNAKAKAGAVSVVCKRVNGKLIWAKVKVSADCTAAQNEYANANKAYQGILDQITQAKTALGSLSGPDADELRSRIIELERGVPVLDAAVKSLKSLTASICAIG